VSSLRVSGPRGDVTRPHSRDNLSRSFWRLPNAGDHMRQLVPTDIVERIARSLSASNGALSTEDGAEFGRALADLVARTERAAVVLRQLIELVNPQVVPQELHLTPRELEMLTHLAEGSSNSEIAKKCWVSENTVKFHLKNVFRKLNVRDRGQAMMIARAIQRRLDYFPAEVKM
jgi:DNA-binding CsgD family transcriptional regulator